MRNQYVGKDMKELRHTIDSVGLRLDSTGQLYGRELQNTAFPLLLSRNVMRETGEREKVEEKADTALVQPVDVDSLLLSLNPSMRGSVFDAALNISQRQVTDYQFKSMVVHDDKYTIRRHKIELLKKFTLSVACLIFFFIGAPLGAIIRKGGLGTPLVISVLLFLVYYIIDNAATRWHATDVGRYGKVSGYLLSYSHRWAST